MLIKNEIRDFILLGDNLVVLYMSIKFASCFCRMCSLRNPPGKINIK